MFNRPYLLIAIAAGVAAYFVLGPWIVPRMITRVLVSWDFAIIAFLWCCFVFMRKANGPQLQQRAVENAVGDRAVLAAALIASVASIGALVAELSSDKHYPPRFGIALATVVLSWLFVQIVFAIHYAHRYYMPGKDGGIAGGLAFGEAGEPDYWDFVHFSIVIGATAQTADITFTSRGMRHIGTLHTLAAFAFNTAILATMINLAAGLI